MDGNRKEKYKELIGLIGHTPLYEISHISVPNGNRIFAKEEYLNPTGSHYDRVFIRLFEALEELGLINPGQELVETTSGNAGSAFAWLCEVLDYKGTVLIPEDMPAARLAQIESFGAKTVLTPRLKYVAGVIQALRDYLRSRKESNRSIYCMNHAESPFSVEGIRPCGSEIVSDLTDLGVFAPDYFIAGLGGGIHIRGIGEVLIEHSPRTQLIGVEPFEAPEHYLAKFPGRFEVEYGVPATLGPHELLGIGRWGDTSYRFPHISAILPKLSEIILVRAEEWMAIDSELKNREAKLVGHTSAANLWAALKLARTVENKVIVTMFYDPAWKYFDHLMGERPSSS